MPPGVGYGPPGLVPPLDPTGASPFLPPGLAPPQPAPVVLPAAPVLPEDFNEDAFRQAMSTFGAAQPIQQGLGFEPVQLEEPELLPVPDAVSGGEIPAPNDEPQLPDEYKTAEDEQQRLSAMSDEDFAVEQARQAKEREEFVARRHAEKAAENIADAERAALGMKTAAFEAKQQTEQILLEAKELGQKRIDSNRRGRELASSPGAWIAALAAGLVAPHNGGRNTAIEAFQRDIDRDVEAQVQDLANQRQLLGMRMSAVAEQYARHGDIYRAAETVRLARWEQVDVELAAEQAKYDPRGTTAMKLEMTRRGAQARAAESAFKIEGELLKRAETKQKMVIERSQEERAMRAERRAAANAGASRRAAEAKWLFENDAVKLPDGSYARNPNAPQDTKKALELREQAAKTAKAEREVAASSLETPEQTKLRELGIGGLKRKDGKPILARNETTGGQLAATKASTDEAVRLLSELIALREEHGWSSNLFKSDEWRQMKANQGTLKLALKDAAKLGVMSETDSKLLDEVIGSSDPTEIRDPIEGWKKSKQNAIRSFNDKLKAEDSEAAFYTPPESEKAKAYERSKKENLDIASQPVPPHARGDEQKAAEYQEASKAATEVALKRQNPSSAELGETARKIDAQVQAGERPLKSAIEIVVPMALKVAKEERKRIQDMDTDELLKLQKDPDFMRRARMLQLAETGDARPEELYQIAVGAK